MVMQKLIYEAEELRFYSEGVPVAALLWAPKERADEKLPAIVVCRGFGANKEFVTPGFARELNKSGIIVLGFDYRGVGESGGEAGRLIPKEHVEDIRSAITYLQSLPTVDPERIGLFGDSIGGGYVPYVAGIDSRVKCTISLGGQGNGLRWIRGGWGYERLQKLLAKIEQDKRERVITGKSGYIPVKEFLPWGEQELEDWDIIVETFGQQPRSIGGPVTLESCEKYLEFNPEDVVDKISPRAIMFTTAGVSVVVPPDECMSMYEKAKEPKRLWVQPLDTTPTRYGSHHGQDGYTPEITKVYIDWFLKYL